MRPALTLLEMKSMALPSPSTVEAKGSLAGVGHSHSNSGPRMGTPLSAGDTEFLHSTSSLQAQE